MKCQLSFGLLALAGLAQAATTNNLAFVLVGDSTTENTTIVDSGGWGNGFCNSLKNGFATPCINTAHNASTKGATTGSFVAGGFFNISLGYVKQQVALGKRTLVTIQFGHNDMKIAPPESMGANITAMVKQLRAIGGEPVLVTSLTRRIFFSNGTINNGLAPWAAETRLIAQQQKTHLLDLNAASIKYCESIGSVDSNILNRTPNDTTHLNSNGTIIFGRMVAELFNASYPATLPLVPIAGFPDLDRDIMEGLPVFTAKGIVNA